MSSLVRRWVPMAFEAWEDQVKGGVHLNRRELEFVRRLAMGSGDQLGRARRVLKSGETLDDIKMTAREWAELRVKIVGME